MMNVNSQKRPVQKGKQLKLLKSSHVVRNKTFDGALRFVILQT